MYKKLAPVILCATLLSGCTGQSMPAQSAKDSEQSICVSAICTDFNPSLQYGTMEDENGEIWYFENVQLQQDKEYQITYEGQFELISLSDNGKIIAEY